MIGVAHLHQQAVCASATNRRAWGPGLHHVLDGRTGLPTNDILATWVIADDAAVADALATALFFTAPHQLATIHRFTYVRVGSDGRVDSSPTSTANSSPDGRTTPNGGSSAASDRNSKVLYARTDGSPHEE